jgi:hypothetical protein
LILLSAVVFQTETGSIGCTEVREFVIITAVGNGEIIVITAAKTNRISTPADVPLTQHVAYYSENL